LRERERERERLGSLGVQRGVCGEEEEKRRRPLLLLSSFYLKICYLSNFLHSKIEREPCMAMAFLQEKNKVKGPLAETKDSLIFKLTYLFVK
jgi:hypothetical protein